MVMQGNKAILVDSKTCQRCGKCCKEFVCGGWDLDSAVRMMWMDSKDIKVRESIFRDDFGNIKREVVFKYPCRMLVRNHDKYSCSAWNKDRPNFCCTYPDHMFWGIEEWDTQKIEKMLIEGAKDCPGLQTVTKQQVQDMLAKHRSEV